MTNQAAGPEAIADGGESQLQGDCELSPIISSSVNPTGKASKGEL